VSLLTLSYLLRRRGWPVVYLGANVPVERFEDAVGATDVRLIVMSAQQLRTAATLAEMSEALVPLGVPLAYGGLIFNLIPELRDRVAGHFLGEKLDTAIAEIESLMVAPRAAGDVQQASDAQRQARAHYADRRPWIELRLTSLLNGDGMVIEHLELASRELAANLSAALELGDLNYLGADIEWIGGLLRQRGAPPGALTAFLRAYHQAAEAELDERGQPILDWFSSLLGDFEE
jgi:hypothetical protein